VARADDGVIVISRKIIHGVLLPSHTQNKSHFPRQNREKMLSMISSLTVSPVSSPKPSRRPPGRSRPYRRENVDNRVDRVWILSLAGKASLLPGRGDDVLVLKVHVPVVFSRMRVLSGEGISFSRAAAISTVSGRNL
jgi:hypothetical protein